MPNATYHQTSFLGGEWAPTSMGRSDDPHYRQSLSVAVNHNIAEFGAITRRSGTEFICPTYKRAAAKLLPYSTGFFIDGTIHMNLAVEFTPGAMRYFYLSSPLFTTSTASVLTNSFASNLLTVGVNTTDGLAVGDNVMLVNTASIAPATFGVWQNRMMQITAISTLDVTLGDDIGAVFGSGISSGTDDLAGATLYQVMRTATSYVAADIQNIRMVLTTIGGNNAPAGIVLSSAQPPYTLLIDNAGLSFAVTSFLDGPYLDQQGTFAVPETGTVGAYTGSITFTPATTTFVGTDVGRQIRLFSQPAAWASGTTYAYGNTVTYGNEWWVAIDASTGIIPGTAKTSGGVQSIVWAPAPTAGQWAWGTITAQATTSCTVSLVTNLNSTNGTTISVWQLGVFKVGQYPTCGAVRDGRLILGGAVANRFDCSTTNDVLTFSPTDINGNVLSDSGMSETFNDDTINTILWMANDHEGIIAGTKYGEWLIDDGGTGQGLSPTTIRVRKLTAYGCANIEPRRVGMALIFVQTIGQMVYEFLADAFTGKYSGKQITDRAKHLTVPGVVELAYQENPIPTIWARLADGSIVNCTYRRVSRFITEDPISKAWMRQVLGGNYANDLSRPATGMCVVANEVAFADYFYLATTDASGDNGWIELMQNPFEAM
jgi:hypothetical protein